VSTILTLTNAEMANQRRGAPIDQDELFCWIAIRIGMCLERSRGSIDKFWDDSPGHFVLASNYRARTGMSLNRFKAISRCLRLGPEGTQEVLYTLLLSSALTNSYRILDCQLDRSLTNGTDVICTLLYQAYFWLWMR
jgi:hypothetical protein